MKILLLLLAVSARAVTNSPYAPTIRTSTSTGVTTMSVPGVFNVAAGSASADTPVISLNGASGVVTATSFSGSGSGLTGLSSTFAGGTVAGQTTFLSSTTNKAAAAFAGGIFVTSGSSLTLTGANGFITTGSSINASAFFGNGAGITGIATTFTGGNVTGAVTFQSSVTLVSGSLSAGGAGNFVIVASSVGIGVGTPTQKLDVYGAIQENGGILVSSGPYSALVPNTRGIGSNDLMLSKLAVTNIAAGAYSVLTGGSGTEADGDFSGVFGGRGNVASADYTFIGGGRDNAANNTYAIVLGGQLNNSGVTAGIYSAIGGGVSNRCQGAHCVVGGGASNWNSGSHSVLTGGDNNRIANVATADYSFMGGGESNLINAYYGSLGGGISNAINTGADNAFIGGGTLNQANGVSSTVPGGSSNTANGNYSFAAGFRAYAGARGTFVWGDSTNAALTSSTTDQFLVRAQGGVVLQTSSITVQGNSYLGTGLGITTITASGFLIAPAWTLARIQAYTPSTSEKWGQIICTDCSSAGSVCQSTGTTINGFRLGTTGTAGCQ